MEGGREGRESGEMLVLENMGRSDPGNDMRLRTLEMRKQGKVVKSHLVLIWRVGSRVTLLIERDIVRHVRLWDLLVRKEGVA